MRIMIGAVAIVLSVTTPLEAHSQSDPLSNLRALGNSVKALGRIGKKSVVAEDSNVAAADETAAQTSTASERTTNVTATKLIKGDAATFDIGGVKLGMSPSEVEQVAKARGLKVYDLARNNPSFDQAVSSKMKEMRRQYADLVSGQTSFMRLQDSQGSIWSVHYAVSPEGPRVYLMEYSTSINGRTPEGFAASLIEKYGVPNGGASRLRGPTFKADWCTRTGLECGAVGSGARPPHMEAYMTSELLPVSRTRG